MKVWRPRISRNSPSINRENRLFAIACRTHREADAVEKALIRTFIKVRKKPFTEIVPVVKEKK